MEAQTVLIAVHDGYHRQQALDLAAFAG